MLDTCAIDSEAQLRFLDEHYPLRVVAKVALRKLQRRLWGERSKKLKPVASYNGLVVFDRPDLHGGGLTFGQDFFRVLLQLGVPRRERIYEFCAGPGYIGYALLAYGFCENLTLADINPVAVAAAQETAKHNGIESRVNIYCSDCLNQVPVTEKWDLVVGNPPHFLSSTDRFPMNLRAHDPGWSVHRRFYGAVRQFMKPGSLVVLMENVNRSNPGIFREMIWSGGGKLVEAIPSATPSGGITEYYYVVSKW
ncbi:MAG: methyltransferase [Acidobacteria bacterium]|nr:methyltransferase [Acidobacteriota bacterium]